MSRKRHLRNSKKFKKTVASKRARMPMQTGGAIVDRMLGDLSSGKYKYGEAGKALRSGTISQQEFNRFQQAYNEQTGTTQGSRNVKVGETVSIEPPPPVTGGSTPPPVETPATKGEIKNETVYAGGNQEFDEGGNDQYTGTPAPEPETEESAGGFVFADNSGNILGGPFSREEAIAFANANKDKANEGYRVRAPGWQPTQGSGNQGGGNQNNNNNTSTSGFTDEEERAIQNLMDTMGITRQVAINTITTLRGGRGGNQGGGNQGGGNTGGTSTSLPTGAPIDLEIERPDLPTLERARPQDVEVGPDSEVFTMEDTGDAEVTKAEAAKAEAAPDATVATADTPSFGIPSGYSTTPAEGQFYPSVQPPEGKIFIYSKETGERIAIDKPDGMAAQMEAAIAKGVAPGEAATRSFDPRARVEVDEATLTERVRAAGRRDSAAEEAAKAVAAQRPEEREYAEGITTDERFKVIEAEDPEVATRVAQTISERAKKDLMDIVTGEGVDLDDIPEFKLAEKRTAQVAEAQQGIAQDLGNAPSVDLQGRQAITGEAPKGDAAQIGGVPTMAAAQRQAVTGEARRAAAADMNAVVGNLPPKITAAVLDDPQAVEAQLDTAPVAVKAAVAALPKEALVSTQMEGLLAGMEDGKIPAWAKPAVDAINAQMASRGLSTSTVGRDALFNAIIQSALPIAQSNAQALQQRAAQNLSNEQQANLQQASQVMQQRMANLSNRQTAASQTAAMAQEINVRQAEFEQQAVLTTAQQEQQTRTQNLQNAQQRAVQESAQRQQTALANLDAATRTDLANLDALNQAGAQNLNAEQQSRLANYNAKVQRVMRQAELDQDMEKANLSAELQVELKNLTEQNAAARDTMTAENQERLANLNVLVDFKKTNASLAQQMDLANMNAAQQVELANLAERAATDAANFTEANRFRLQELTTAANVLSQNAELRQRAEMAQLSAAEKVELANLTAKNQADSENMNAENIASLQVFEKRMQAGQVNAQLAQQMGLANLSNKQQAAMFNAQIDANLDMKQFDFEQQAVLANSQFMQTMTMKEYDAIQQSVIVNATNQAKLDLANLDVRAKAAAQNAQNFLSLSMANLNNRQQMAILNQQQAQQTMLSNQAAENAARQFNAASQQQADQFIANLSAQTDQFNAAQTNAMSQFNISEQNRISAQNAQNQTQVSLANAQMATEIDKFNTQMDQQREQFNIANKQAIEQADVAWRRQTNTINTAARNAMHQQNVMNAFNLDMSELQYLWQEARDNAAYTRQAYENDQTRRTQLYATAIGNESAAGEKSSSSINSLISAVTNLLKLGG